MTAPTRLNITSPIGNVIKITHRNHAEARAPTHQPRRMNQTARAQSGNCGTVPPETYVTPSRTSTT